MVDNDKNSLVDYACRELIEKMRSDMKSLYKDIEAQASEKSADTFLSYLSMLEKSKVSAYARELLNKMRTAFSKALRQTFNENGGRRYTDSQVTLMWQSIAVEISPPELTYMDIRKIKIQAESDNARGTTNHKPSVPVLSIIGVGLGIAGVAAAGGVSPASMAWIIRGVSVGIGGVSAYDIYRKMFGAAPAHEMERRVDSHAFTKITDAQYVANTEILEKWIHSVGERVKEGEPIL